MATTTATVSSRVRTRSASYGTVDTLLASSQQQLPSSAYLFKFLVLTQVFMYLEAGAVPSLLQQFTLTFRLTPQEQGVLGAIVYMAISLASPWCSALFRRFDPRQLLGVSLVVNNLAVLAFACAPTTAWYSTPLLISFRGLIGLTQSLSCVYSPLWVHDYAPKAKRGAWMSYLQGAVPVGITLGYFAGSVAIWSASQDSKQAATASQLSIVPTLYDIALAATTSKRAGLVDSMDDALSRRLCHGIYCWRWPFLTQFALVLPLCILIFFVPRAHVQLRSTRRRRSIAIVDIDEDEDVWSEQRTTRENCAADDQVRVLIGHERNGTASNGYCSRSSESHEQAEPVSRWSDLQLLLQQKVYVCIVMGLSGLFFVVAGIQFWTTLYLETNTKDSVYKIHAAYLLVSGTGPLAGVFFGGWLIDQFGGYSGPYHQKQALRVCVVLGGASCLVALPLSFVHNTVYIAVLLWLMLFCGGSILPACSGIVISAAPRRLRPLASSVAYASYNFFGYAASNYIPGLIMNFIINPVVDVDPDADGLASVGTCNAACTYRVGFRIVLLWSVWAFFCLTCGAVESGRNYVATATAHHNGREGGKQLPLVLKSAV